VPNPVDLATIAADQTRELPTGVAGQDGEYQVGQHFTLFGGVKVGRKHLIEVGDEAVLDVF